MSALLACTGCSRHVHVDEARCPFCDALVTPTRSPSAQRIDAGQLTRALIFSGVAAVSLAACEEQPIAQPYGAPPDPDPGGETRPPDDQQQPPDDDSIAQPYGAPPEDPDPTPEAPPE